MRELKEIVVSVIPMELQTGIVVVFGLVLKPL